MKDKLLTVLTVVLIGALLVILQSCKHDDASPDEQSIFIGKISQTWKTNRVTVDGVDVTSYFKDMAITFRGDQTYTVANPVSPIWPASGLFETVATTDGSFDIERSDGVMIDVTSLAATSVILELLYTSPNGRVAEVTGHYKFELTR